jgi:hypothetical protein
VLENWLGGFHNTKALAKCMKDSLQICFHAFPGWVPFKGLLQGEKPLVLNRF